MYPKLSKAAIYRQAKKPAADKTVDKENIIMADQKQISPPEERLILRQLPILREQYGSFTIQGLRLVLELEKMCQMKQ